MLVTPSDFEQIWMAVKVDALTSPARSASAALATEEVVVSGPVIGRALCAGDVKPWIEYSAALRAAEVILAATKKK